jgi:hypothetical protein
MEPVAASRGEHGTAELTAERVAAAAALTPGSAISENTVRSRLRIFVFGSRVSEDGDQLAKRTHMVTDGLSGRTAISPVPPVFCSVNSTRSATQAEPFTTTPGRSESPVERGKGDADDSCRDSGAYLVAAAFRELPG